jgi:hypothetical protein
MSRMARPLKCPMRVALTDAKLSSHESSWLASAQFNGSDETSMSSPSHSVHQATDTLIAPRPSSLADVIDTILNNGLVIAITFAGPLSALSC